MEEVKKAIAFLFKRKGRESMADTDFVMSASMDLRWFSPKDAQRLLQIGLDSKLLVVSEGKVKPSFDVSSVSVPMDYTPPQTLLDVKVTSPNLFNSIVDRILAATKLEKRQLVSMVNATQSDFDVEIEVAALMVGQDLGIDVSDLVDKVEKEVISRLR